MNSPTSFGQTEIATFGDVKKAIAFEPLPRPQRRGQLVGSINNLQKVCRLPDNMPMPQCWDKIRATKYRRHGFSKRRWQNMQTDLRFACRQVGMDVGRDTAPLSEQWERYLDLQRPEFRKRINRFARWCSKRQISPHDVNDDAAAEYRTWLDQAGFAKDPRHGFRLLARSWNSAADQHSDWPAYRFDIAPKGRIRTLEWDAFPSSLKEDVDQWQETVEASGSSHWLSSSLDKPLKPATVRTRLYNLQVLCSAAVRAGVPAERLQSLSDLVEPDVTQAALAQLHAEFGNETTSWLEKIAETVLPIARHYVEVAEPHYLELQGFRKRLAPDHRGLSEKTMDRLRQFDHRKSEYDLLSLPSRTIRRLAKKEEVTRKDALDAQSAVAIAILLYAPVRLGNLVSIRLDHHLRGLSGRHETPRLVFEAAEVKNRVRLEFPLPPDVTALIRPYLTRCLPVLAPGGSDCIFPGRPPQTPKAAAGLSRQLSRFVLDQIGVEINVHLFRHLAAQIHLQEHPGEYAVVKEVLGHKDINTTINIYAYLQKENSIHLAQQVMHGRSTAKPRP